MNKTIRIFLTGMPKCGKSTVVQKIMHFLKEKNIPLGGILTPEIRVGSSRYGFKIIDISSGKEGILASIDLKSKYRVGKYGVNRIDIDRIVAEFEKSLKNANIIIIDEIGKMELYSEKFKNSLTHAISSGKTMVATLHRNFVNEFKKYGEVIVVNEKNRDLLPMEILQKIGI